MHVPQNPEFKVKATGFVLLAATIAALPGNRAYYFLGFLLLNTYKLLSEIYSSNCYLPRQWHFSPGLLLDGPWLGWLLVYCIWMAIGRHWI